MADPLSARLHALVRANGFWLVDFLRKLFVSSPAAFSGFVLAAPLMAGAAAPSSEVEACLRVASTKHAIAYPLLRAIAETESSFNPDAVRRPFMAGGNGTTDYGLMQINSGWLPALAKYGISKEDLFKPCVSADVAGWILSQNFKRLGVTWDAVGAYNAMTPWKRIRYSTAVHARLRKYLGAPASTARVLRTPAPAVGYLSDGHRNVAQIGIGVWEASSD